MKMLHWLRFSSYRVLPVLRRLRKSLAQSGLLRLPIERQIWKTTHQGPAIISNHWWTPFRFVSALHCCNVLVETFTVLVTHRTTVLRKEVQMRTQKVAISFWHSNVPCLCCPTHTGNKKILCTRAAVQAKVQWLSGLHKCSTCMCHFMYCSNCFMLSSLSLIPNACATGMEGNTFRLCRRTALRLTLE